MNEVREPVLSEADLPQAPPAGAGASPELLDLLCRERADFVNYKRRVERERADDRERARLDLLRELLPLLDDIDRAIAQQPAELLEHPWAQGVALSHRRLSDALRRVGLERVGAEGEPFDPTVHEAVLHQGQADDEQQVVTSVFRPGYRLGGHLLRPAQVVVGGAPRTEAEQRPPGDGSRRHSSRRRLSRRE